jgi:hypothetical protein
MTEPDTTEDIVEAAAAAWWRLTRREHTTWGDWVAFGHGLEIGRTQAMLIAGTNRPFGRKYSAAIRQWLEDNELSGSTEQERYALRRCIQNLPAIEAWRSTLSDEQRRRFNHPGGVWAKFQAATRTSAAAPALRLCPHCGADLDKPPARRGRTKHRADHAQAHHA